MKPHVELTVRPGTRPRGLEDAPYWEDIIRDKARAVEPTEPQLAAVLRRHRRAAWATHAYAPRGGGWSRDEIASGLDRIYRLVLQVNGDIPEALIRDIRLLPYVESAHAGRVAAAPMPEPRAAAMGAGIGQDSRDAIHLPEAQGHSTGDPGVVVAVLDTGVWLDHPEYADVVLPGRDVVDILDGAASFFGDFLDADDDPTDPVGHGTHVAGIIAARGLHMPVGVVPRCRILPVRVLGAMRQGERRVGAGLVDNINVGIKWAVDQGAQVINMSLGIRHTAGGLPHAEVIEYARRQGVTVVAAAGNDGREELYYPGALPYVIAVGAVDGEGSVAPYSTWGMQVSLVAPGTNIYSSYLEGGYAFSTGTSHATPFVSGAVAMLRSVARARGVALGDAQGKHVLKHTADKVGRAFKDRKAGFGQLNLLDAVRLLEHKLEQAPAHPRPRPRAHRQERTLN
ncbi:MAG TPA: S8 family serine peptidase [Gemmatimonadaceae bacterium]